MQASARSPEKKSPDAAFGAFLFALGIVLFSFLLSTISHIGTVWPITLLLGFAAGLSVAGGLFLIIREAVRSSR